MNPTPQPNTATYRPFLERLGGSPISEFVGEYGEIFYDPANPTIESLRISDGETPGGLLLAQNVIDRVQEIYDSIDGSKLAEIKDVIDSFIASGMEEYEILLERLVDLEQNSFNKTGGIVAGIIDVKPTGVAGISHFRVTPDTVETPIPPTTNFSVVNKKYVDDNTLPFNLRRLQALPS